MVNKYNAVRTYSGLCQRIFSSKAECARADELYLLQRAGEISDLQYQVKFILCKSPKVTITVDFSYKENGETVLEDQKGWGETREFRVKRIWLKTLTGQDIKLIK